MALLPSPTTPISIEYIPSSRYEAKLPVSSDPFRHKSLSNSHNHHDLHPWGSEVKPNSQEFDSLYAQANNQFMYHLWYSPKLEPYMATEVVIIKALSDDTIKNLEVVLRRTLQSGIDVAIQTNEGEDLKAQIQSILDHTPLHPDDRIFVRLGATSAKDSFALNVPTAKPSPIAPDADMIVRRLLTSARCVGRLLALSDGIWPNDPGEALIIQKWSPDIELRKEFRVFCYAGRITAISQDIWWEKMGWRNQYSGGFVDAIVLLWDHVKDALPFSTCTMDVFISKDSSIKEGWKASVIEFNGFGAHLNTGSDLFHWIRDAEILYGQRPGITVRFVDDWEDNDQPKITESVERAQVESKEGDLPDWLALETKLREKYGSNGKGREDRLETGGRLKIPLRGRWCSAY